MTELKKPQVGGKAQSDLDKAEKQFKKFDENVKELTLDRMNEAPKAEQEQQTKLSQKELEKDNRTYLKPKKTISDKAAFNEKYRTDYNFAKEYVNFTAENKEIIGESIEMWTKPFAGVPAEYWEVPVNRPVWGPRYLAEQIKRCTYHRLSMNEQKIVGGDGVGSYTGAIVVDETRQRLDAHPVSEKRSVFMGASGF